MVTIPAPVLEALQYQNGLDWFFAADTALGIAIPFLLLFSGWAARLARYCRTVCRGHWLLGLCLFALLYALLSFLLDLPLSYWRDYIYQHRYGLGTDSQGQWLRNKFFGFLPMMAGGLLFTWIPYVALRKHRRFWLAWSVAGLSLVFLGLAVVKPLWIYPLIFKFTPISDQVLEAKLRATAARAGIGNAPIFVVDLGSQSNVPNAAVLGRFGTARIAIGDTALDQSTERQLFVIFAHEMGHFIRGDQWLNLAADIGLLALSLIAVALLGRPIIRRYGARLGFADIDDPASLPLFYLSYAVICLVTLPALNAEQRHIEREADKFALELTHDNEAGAAVELAFLAMAKRVPYPGWFAMAFREDHPSLGERIKFAESYRPWETGDRPAYGDLIKAPAVE